MCVLVCKCARIGECVFVCVLVCMCVCVLVFCVYVEIFGNAGFVFILAAEILMNYDFVEFSNKSFVVNQLCKSVRQFCS